MKKYISIGAVTKPSTEHILYISHCGIDYTLTGDLAAMWLGGRFGFDAARNKIQEKTLDQLCKMGLVIVTEDILEGEYRALTWIRETGLVLTMAELVYLMEHNIAPEPKYLGQENIQRLVERIYTQNTICDNILENQMKHAACRDEIVKLVLKLLKKKRIVLL